MTPDLPSVLSDIVLPAIRGVLKPDETEDLRLSVGNDPASGVWIAELQLSVRSEEFFDRVFDSAVADMSPAEWSERLASNLEDFVAESRFGWGQDRRADHGQPGTKPLPSRE